MVKLMANVVPTHANGKSNTMWYYVIVI
jgi:hypothetical protein